MSGGGATAGAGGGGLPEPQELLGQAERVVEKAVAAGADDAEVYWSASESLDLEIAAGRLSATSTGRDAGAGLRVLVGGRLGFAYFTRQQDAGAAIDAALSRARLAPKLDYALPDGGRVAPLPGRFDADVAALDVDRAVRLVDDLLAGAREASPDATVAGGGVSMAAGVEAIASSRGVAAMDQATRLDAGASVILSWGDGDGTAATWDSRGTHTGELDARAVGRTAADKAVRLADPQPLASGKRDVLFAPDAFGELLHGIVVGALMGDDVSRGRSVWADRMGDRVAHEGLSLWDDPRHANGLGTTASDDEGLATRRLPLLEAGRVATFLYDSWDAHEHGAAASPCALRGSFKALPRAGTHHLVLEHASTRPADDLVADVEQGLLVDSILGAHTANPTTGDFSVTAPNAWLIEGGQIVGAAQESAIAGNLPRLLEGLDAVGDDARPAGGGLLPTVRLRDVGVSV